jgi:hypothetical protein
MHTTVHNGHSCVKAGSRSASAIVPDVRVGSNGPNPTQTSGTIRAGLSVERRTPEGWLETCAW